MDYLKFIAISMVVLGLVGVGGYWSVTTLQSGTDHVNVEKIKALENENEALKTQVADLNTKLGLGAEPIKTDDPIIPIKTDDPIPVVKPTTTPTSYKNQTLINELQKMVNNNVVLKVKSTGVNVGTVQKFFNVYNKTSNKIDNDYGGSTKTLMIAFQKAQGLPGSGEASKVTFNKMIDWLKKQG